MLRPLYGLCDIMTGAGKLYASEKVIGYCIVFDRVERRGREGDAIELAAAPDRVIFHRIVTGARECDTSSKAVAGDDVVFDRMESGRGEAEATDIVVNRVSSQKFGETDSDSQDAPKRICLAFSLMISASEGVCLAPDTLSLIYA